MPKDLNALLMPDPSCRIMRVSEAGLEGIGIHRGDLLIIDTAPQPWLGCVVVAVINGSFKARKWTRTSGQVHLITGHFSMPPITFNHSGEVDVFGVVMHVIHSYKPIRRQLVARAAPSQTHGAPVGRW